MYDKKQREIQLSNSKDNIAYAIQLILPGLKFLRDRSEYTTPPFPGRKAHVSWQYNCCNKHLSSFPFLEPF